MYKKVKKTQMAQMTHAYPDCPRFLDHTLFFTDNFENIEKSVQIFCGLLNLEVLSPEKFEYDHDYECTTFGIHKYANEGKFFRKDKDGNKPSFILEIHRYGGCGFGFLEVIRSAKLFFPENLKDTSVIKKLPTNPIPPPVDVDPAVITETVNNLISMSSSDFVDVQQEGMKVLASMSSQKSVQDEIWRKVSEDVDARSGLVLLKKTLYSKIPNIQRCALAILANIFRECDTEENYYKELKTAVEFCAKSSIPKVLTECKRVFVAMRLE